MCKIIKDDREIYGDLDDFGLEDDDFLGDKSFGRESGGVTFEQ